MIDIDEAYDALFAHVTCGGTVEVPLEAALYRTLAAPVCCGEDHPPFDRAVMDGYAVRAADVAAVPLTLKVVGQIPAGTVANNPLMPGEAVQINTGAPIPPEADAVVMVERTEQAGGKGVVIHEAARPGQFITARGTYVSAGKIVLEADMRITPVEIGVAAAAGVTRLTVYRRPSVAVLVTGDELVDADKKPVGAEIRNANQHLLTALISAAHAEPVALGVARDDRDLLRERVVEGLRSDMLCLTGGVSMGAFDLVPEVLEACGVTFHIRKMAIKPGRPTIFGTASDGTPVFGLPGNPISAFVGFELLVKPALAAMEGRPGIVPPLIRATIRGSVEATSERRSYVPARARVNDDGEWDAEPLSWHGSGDVFGMVTANALIVRPPQVRAAASGEAVSIHLLDRV